MKIFKVIAMAGVMVSPALSFANEQDHKTSVVKEKAAIALDEVGASLTPAEQHQQRFEKERMRDGGELSPKMKAQRNSAKFPTEHHKNAYHSLSDKNQKAYDALEDHEQDKVAETYRNGGNHQRTLTNILKSDQKDHDKAMKNKGTGDDSTLHMYQHDKGMSDSPATRTMKKQAQQKKKKDDIFS